MTEEDWLTTMSLPKAMLRHAMKSGSPRKFRLVGCACCRLIRQDLSIEARQFIHLTSLHADGLISVDELSQAREMCRYPVNHDDYQSIENHINQVVASLAHDDVCQGSIRAVDWLVALTGTVADTGQKLAALSGIRSEICAIIREVFGNPFRRFQPVASWLGGGFVQPDGLTVRATDTLSGLAAGIEAEQAFERLPLLADALEDAGASDPDLLTHCRTPDGHVRGCWALDAVLGKS